MLDSASIAMIVGLVFCVIMSGYFSATETAFTSLNLSLIHISEPTRPY